MVDLRQADKPDAEHAATKESKTAVRPEDAEIASPQPDYQNGQVEASKKSLTHDCLTLQSGFD